MNVWLAALGLFTTPFILRGLGASAYGVFAMSSLVSAHLSNLEFGFGFATVRYVARARGAGDRQAERSILNTSLAIFMAGAMLSAGLFFAGAHFLATRVFEIPDELKSDAVAAFRLGAAILGCSFLSSFFTGALQSLGHFGVFNACRTVFGSLAAGGAVAVVAAGGGLRGVFVVQAVIALLSVCVLACCLAYVRGEVAVPRLDVRAARDMAAFGALVFVAGIAYQWMINGPGLILAAKVAAAEIPAYSIPHGVLQKLILVISSAGVVFFPFVSGQSAGTDRALVSAVFQAHLRLTLLVLGPISAFLAVFAERLLGVWITPEFGLAGGPSLRALAGAALVMGIASPAADVARGFGRPVLVLAYTFAVAAVAALASFVLVPTAGPVGAAWALLVSLLLVTIPFLLLVARALLGLRISVLARSLAAPTAAVFLVTLSYAVGRILYAGAAGALATAVVGTLVYVVVIFRGVLEPREVKALKGAFPVD